MENEIMKELEGTNMKVKTWKINTEFLGEDKRFETLPIGYINKDVCGCGATSIVLRNDINAIIAVPNLSLIYNKTQQQKIDEPTIIGVTGSVSDDYIETMVLTLLSKDQPFKIMVTFDSLYRVEKYISYRTPNKPELTQLVIDEADQLLSNMELKVSSKAMKDDFLQMDACSRTFEIARKYKNQVTFITASNPIMKLYPDWILNELIYHKFEFANNEVITPILFNRDIPTSSLVDEILVPIINKGYVKIKDLKIEKVIVFFNNVSKTVSIIEELGIKEESGMICGDNKENETKRNGINLITDYSNLPKYTFVTSAGFQGIDIYDNKTMNVVVSNSARSYQALDIDTDLKQSISRQRLKNNPNFKYYVFIYNENASSLDFEKERRRLESEYNYIAQYIDDINDKIKANKTYDHLIRMAKKSTLFKKIVQKREDGYFQANNKLYEIIYSKKLKNSLDYAEGNIKFVKGTEAIIIEEPKDPTSTTSYDYIYKIYKKSTKTDIRPEYTEAQLKSEAYQLIDKLYNKTNKLYRSKQYAEKKLKELIVVNTTTIDDDVRNEFTTRQEYTRNEVKSKLEKIYKLHKLKRKPQFRDISKFGIEYEECTKDRERAVRILKKLRRY